MKSLTSMKSLLGIVVIGVLFVGCAMFSSPATDLLNQADTKLTAEDYSGAVALYTEMIESYPNDAQAPRARATRTVLERLLTAQTALARTQSEELPKARREVSDRQSEVNQLRAEMAKLRADLERLRNIDLQDIKK